MTMYRLQNAAVAVSAFSAFVASYLGLGSLLYRACVLALIFAAAISSVGCQGSSLSVEREWTKALCQGDSASLAGLNAGGLSAKVCARHCRGSMPCAYIMAAIFVPSAREPLHSLEASMPARFITGCQMCARLKL